jgi:hypothetical protein
MTRAGIQTVAADPTGQVATVNLPTAPNDADVIWIVPVSPTAGVAPATPISGGVAVTARGGTNTVADFNNPGAFTAALGTSVIRTYGPVAIQYESAKTRWVEIV